MTIVTLNYWHIVVERVTWEVFDFLEWVLASQKPIYFHVVHKSTLAMSVMLVAPLTLKHLRFELLTWLTFDPGDSLKALRVVH